ncbi:MAG: hypothetical protein AAFX39_10280 [Pseudomonadota bacterium]
MVQKKKRAESGPDVRSVFIDAEPEDVASYIAEILSGLTKAAKQNQLDFLAYLIEMAEVEARIEASRE